MTNDPLFNSQLVPWPEQERESDERYTPRWIFDGLALTFDTDPASPVNGGDCVPATVKYTRLEDGLAQPWHGLVWLNPPFSNCAAWAQRFRQHGRGVFLGPVGNSHWWRRTIAVADVVWFCGDFAFTHPTHAGRRSPMPLAICAMGEPSAEAVRGLAKYGAHDGGRHSGVLVVPERT